MTFAFIVEVLRRRWRVIAVCALIGVLGGVALWAATPTRYSATTSLVVSAGVSNPFTGTKEEVNIRTEQEILGSREVAQRASEALGVTLNPGSFLLSQVDVAAPSGSQVLQVTVSADSPTEAARAADALSEAYLEFRREGADTVVNGYLEKIDAQLVELQGRPQDAATSSLVQTLQQQRLSLLLTTSEPGRIIGEAEVPSSAATPGLTVSLAGGLVGGLLLGVAAALLRERTDPRVRSADRLGRVVGEASVVDASTSPTFWVDLADRVVETSSGTQSPRVLLREIGVPGSTPSAARLEEALEAVARAGVLAATDPWEARGASEGAVVPSDADTDTAPDAERDPEHGPDRSLDGETLRVVDSSGPHSLGVFARLVGQADVVTLLVDERSRLADVAAVWEALDGREKPVVVGLTRSHPRQQDKAVSPSELAVSRRRRASR
ncbi:Wzz/FepE/Etk N-terminal domain-containing protein [uncultured Microbacterium sp.]|uniref:YveK family protein n=1 Tax=uncultured Microbacterium sp. TaxID=191216 RepID=UPI0028DB8962|nr:Wzz/FepE/Etk N-terminal domain-containing protein [uncultured Microbacterium sp.]